MKKTLKLIMSALLIGFYYNGSAQEEWRLPPQSTEQEIRFLSEDIEDGWVYRKNKDGSVCEGYLNDTRKYIDENQLYEVVRKKADYLYRTKYPNFIIRNFKATYNETYERSTNRSKRYLVTWHVSASIVVPIPPDPVQLASDNLSKVIEKGMQNVSIGSRIAIDQIKVISGIDEEDYKDKVVEVLLDKGYKVVAKEFLQRLYDEQIQQQTGVYNEDTKVQGNNFSAVGYYLNIRMTDKSLKVQVINVSTGEYEGNATVNF